MILAFLSLKNKNKLLIFKNISYYASIYSKLQNALLANGVNGGKMCNFSYYAQILPSLPFPSECQGNCEFAQRVRNRDVLRPPFPQRDERTGDFFIRECPSLYEVEQCTPRGCAEESPFAKVVVVIKVG